MTTYVYEGSEVKLTGRTAIKSATGGKQLTLYEITPTDPLVGRWLKWVQMVQLFEIQEAPKSGTTLPNL